MNRTPAAQTHSAAAGGEAMGTLAFLADLSQALAVSFDLDRTLPDAVDRIVRFFDTEGAALFLIDRVSGVLECRICVGPVDMLGTRLAVGQGVVGLAVAQDSVQVVADAINDERVWRAADEQSGFVTRSLLCAPLSSADGPLGAIELVNRRNGAAFGLADAELLRSLAAPIALAINSARMAADLLEQQRLKREFELARRMQKALLPRRRRDAYPVLGINMPAHEMSGDFYDYFDLDDGRIGFMIGDVSGKGLDAAMLMARAASLLRWIGKDGPTPAAWLARANAEICSMAREGRFLCALVGYCDRDAQWVQWAGAGFPPALLHRDGAFVEYLSSGPPLGIVPDLAYEQDELTLGDGTLYFFSDGATDVRAANGQPIGSAGLRDLIASHADSAPEARVRAVLGELKRLKLVDDTTLLMIEADRAHAPDVLLCRRFAADADQLRGVRAALRATLDKQDIEPALRDQLVLVVDEACANVIRHAFGPHRHGHIRLLLTRDADGLEFELRDDAPAIDPSCVCPQPLGECRPGGLGVALIDRIMDSWRIEPQAGGRGNRLIMRKHLDEDDEA